LILDEKKIKLTKIVKTINMKIKNNDKKNDNNKKTRQWKHCIYAEFSWDKKSHDKENQLNDYFEI